MNTNTKRPNSIVSPKNSRREVSGPLLTVADNTSTKKLETKTSNRIKLTTTVKSRAKATSISENNIDQTLFARVTESIQRSHNQNVPKKHRRLDSLARLIEGKGICAAVYFNGEKLLITSNALQSTSRSPEKNNIKKLINEVLGYYRLNLAIGAELCDITQLREKFSEQRIELFKEICVKYVHGQMGQAAITGCDEYISKFAEFVLTTLKDPIKDAKNINLIEFEKIIGQEVTDVKVGMLFGAAIVIVPRLARDFRKLEHYFTGDGKSLLKEDPAIVQHGTKSHKLHAEMQVIQDAVNKNNIDRIGYIGISKLCCLDCASVILAINLRNYQNDEYQLDKEFTILTRGQHDLCFTEWKMPEFLEKNELLKGQYCKVKEYIQNIKKNDSKKGHSSMVSANSDSPTTTEEYN